MRVASGPRASLRRTYSRDADGRIRRVAAGRDAPVAGRRVVDRVVKSGRRRLERRLEQGRAQVIRDRKVTMRRREDAGEFRGRCRRRLAGACADFDRERHGIRRAPALRGGSSVGAGRRARPSGAAARPARTGAAASQPGRRGDQNAMPSTYAGALMAAARTRTRGRSCCRQIRTNSRARRDVRSVSGRSGSAVRRTGRGSWS